MSTIESLFTKSYTFFLRNFFLPMGDLVAGQRMISRLRFLENAQWWHPEQIQKFQIKLLRNLMILSDQVPIYKEFFTQSKVSPQNVKDLGFLQALPVVTKDMLRQGFPDRTTRATGQKTYNAATSGSTGKNFYVKEDAETAGWYRATLLLFLEWAGWQIGIPQMQTGMTLNRSLDRKLKDFFLRCYYISAFDLRDEVLSQNLALLERKKIRHLWGYPGSLYWLAKYARKQGWNQPLHSMVTWGDNLYPHYRREIEEVFKIKVLDSYGCGEGFQVAAQCGLHDKYHIHNLDVIVEFLDENNQPVPPGSVGRVVVTRLHPGPMPLIRYQVGDLAIPSDGYCECGRGFSLMQGIEGRDTDVIITPSGNRLIVHFFTGILEHFPEIDSFQVVQESPDLIAILVTENKPIVEETKARIITALQEKGATGMRIEVEVVPDIPLQATGKRRFVINKTKING